MGPLFKNTILKHLNVLKQGRVLLWQLSSRLTQQKGEFLRGVTFHFWLAIWTLQLGFLNAGVSKVNSSAC